ncbi:hypothetical protein CkaCkLH20_11878 [Colletotrichum karsti]|uniref:Uncharacterized protein n=1 Tax=Colletotrichum karsti TaxID=1095194 RepID=A0A9P6LFP4_9PEZI|nr:uncharacterized protein CkaCkLH20_11878 [Colletotrichum karsti]KAF9870572.1 hypothetical protein CkaCkLH20_11878 [Colletotrichum karsti]
MLLPLALACLAPAASVTAFVSGSSCPPSELSVRLPPFLDPAVNGTGNATSGCNAPVSKFVAPPTGFFAGTWSIRNTSGTSYLTYGNLQWDLTPAIATCEKNNTADCTQGTLAGELNEITTWTPADNKTARNGAIGGGGREVASVRAYNTPRRLNFPALNSDWDAVFDNTILEGPGKGFMQSWSVVYWGVDVEKLPFMVVHETPPMFPNGDIGGTAIHAISINRNGPDHDSLSAVLEALMNLGNAELTRDIEKMAATKWDDALKGGPAICGPGCMKNELKK